MTSDLADAKNDKSELCTPALCLDLDKFQSNVRTMVDICTRHDLQWRPHAKCHKSPTIASWLVEAGAVGVTCATISEAEIMAGQGIRNILIANMIVGPMKLSRLVALTYRADPIVCVDQFSQAQAISAAMVAGGSTIRVVIELEIGMNRVGVLVGEKAIALARQIAELPGIAFAGLMAYEGHLLTIADPQQKGQAIHEALEPVAKCRDELESGGLPCPIVSCGGTGSYPITVNVPGITEIQAGGAIFMDAFYRHACQIVTLDFALTILATVVSRPTRDRAVIDAGRKAMNIEIHRPQVVDRPGVEVEWLSAEHGILKLSDDASDLKVGDLIELIPGYADLTTMLHPCFWAFRQNSLEQVIPIVR